MVLPRQTQLTDLGQYANQRTSQRNDLSPTTIAALASVGVAQANLSEADIADRVETDLLYWRVVCLVASRAVTAPVKVDLQSELGDPNDVDTLTQLFREWKGQFYTAQCMAEAFGEAFLTINTQREDGAKTVHTVVRPNTVGRITLAPVLVRLTREGEYYYWPSNPTMRSRKRIHESRIIHFVPRTSAGVVPPEGTINRKSFIQRFAFCLQLYNAGLATALTKMAHREAIVATKKGLDGDVAIADDPVDYVKSTLEALTASLTQNGIALLDGKFDVAMIARSLSGIPDIIAALKDNMIAASNLTESLLFNTTAKAGSIAGAEDPDEIYLSSAVDYLMETSWVPKMNRLIGLLKGAPTLMIRMQSSYKLSATSLAKIQLDLMRASAIAMDWQVMTPPEVRTMYEGDWGPSVQLDPDYVPPRVPKKLTTRSARQATINRSNVQPSDRDIIDPKSEGMGAKNPKRIGDDSDFMRLLEAEYPEVLAAIKEALPTAADRMSDDELAEFITDFGKSQPRVATLRKVEERAIADEDDVEERLIEFCDVWREGDGDTEDGDLLPESKRPSWMTMADGSWLVYFGGRRTPVAVAASSRSEAITKARKLKRRGGNNVVSARQATAAERKTAAAGRWIRTDSKGRPAGKSKLRGYGPKPGG